MKKIGKISIIGLIGFSLFACITPEEEPIDSSFETTSTEAPEPVIAGDRYMGYRLNEDKKSYTAFAKETYRKSLLEIPDMMNNLPVTNVTGFAGNTDIHEIHLPSGMTAISDRAFENCSRLQKINLDNITEIGKSAFSQCDALESAILNNNLIKISEEAFFSCDSLTTVKLPENLKIIEKKAFEECRSIESLDFPYGLESIGDSAFATCSKLKKAIFPNSLKSIGKYSFSYCKKLSELQLGEGLEAIDWYSFQYCISLFKVDFPKNIKTIDHGAFLSNLILDNITIHSKEIYLGGEVFKDCEFLSYIYYDGTKEEFKAQAEKFDGGWHQNIFKTITIICNGDHSELYVNQYGHIIEE